MSRVSFWLGCWLLPLIGCAAPRSDVGSGIPVRKSMITYSELVATPAPAADHRETYGTGPLHFGELRLPKARSRVPVIVLLHGGCWRAAYDLAHVAAAASSLASAGYAVWVPEYRRVGDDGGGWPGTFDDVGSAIDYVRVLARKYPTLDATRVLLAGHSAGGQLALWAASRKPGGSVGTTAGSNPLHVAGVVSLAGITDLAAYASPGGCGSAVSPLMGGGAAEFPDRYQAVSPVDRVPLGVPVQIVHGAGDPIVPLALSRAFVERSTASGEVPVLTEVQGAGHFDVVAPQSVAWPAVLAAVRALAPLR